jgi:hypothetical protein
VYFWFFKETTKMFFSEVVPLDTSINNCMRVLVTSHIQQHLLLSQKSRHCFCFSGGTGVWIYCLRIARLVFLLLEPLHQPLYYDGFFQARILRTIFPGCLWTMILLISATWVGRITGVSHRHPGWTLFLFVFSLWLMTLNTFSHSYWFFIIFYKELI